jgi:TM2 domain-containing membrane protein YozV
LWVFGFVDAYMTAGESNRGIEPKSVDNPRVAAVLNLTTRGFGYFYLGERGKGIALFVILSIVQLFASVLTGRLAALVTVAALAVTIWISVDAYRLARRAFDSQVASMELPPPPQASRLPIAVPLAFAGLTVFVHVALIVTGLVILLQRAPVPS